MNANDVQKTWEFVGSVDHALLRMARPHIAAALRLMAGVAGGEGAGGFEWVPEARVLAGAARGSGELRPALSLGTLTLVVIDADAKERARLDLEGKTPVEAASWLAQQLGLPEPHAVDADDVFERRMPEGFAEFERYFANAWRGVAFALAVGGWEAPVRLSPDDLTLAATVDLGAEGRALQIGFAPSDEIGEVFHYFVRADPQPTDAPDENLLAELEGGGQWRTEGWFGCILAEPEWTSFPAEPMQADTVTMFLESALDETRNLLAAA
jgi:hypothetical protein